MSTVQTGMVFTDEHETVPVDHGLSTDLIANALDVISEVFSRRLQRCESGKKNGSPSTSHAEANEQIPMDKLGLYEVQFPCAHRTQNFAERCFESEKVGDFKV